METQTVFLKQKGMALDLGAIAKGYAADEAGFIIMESGVRRAIVNFGGDVFIFGRKRDSSPWRVGVQRPFEVHGFSIGYIELLPPARTEVSVVTSGIYERYFKKDETVYHHIFSPKTGYPIQNGLSSVTIISRNCMDADAISTCVFVLGYEKGLEFLATFPEIEAVFVDTDFNVMQTADVDFTVIEGAFQKESTELE
jgi:thiamine biosynthesis lipoprotein